MIGFHVPISAKSSEQDWWCGQ